MNNAAQQSAMTDSGIYGPGDDPLLLTREAAAYCRLTEAGMKGLRLRPNAGPRFIRLSATRVAYRKSALDAWLKECERGSTLEDKDG